ncbi:MAG: tetratricopeptide repeat protein [Steroidobacteraceae bacterium]
MAYAEKDYDRALRLFQAAESAGMADSRMLAWKGRLLFAMGRYQQAATLNEQLMKLDPKNGVPEQERWFALMELHQPQEAMRVAGLETVAVGREALRNAVRSMFGGDRMAFEAMNKSSASVPLDTPDHVDAFLGQFVVVGLQYLGRYNEARQAIDRANVRTVRLTNLDWPGRRIGRSPIADLRGWLDLLMADAPEARRDSQHILEFLKSAPQTKWNEWFHTLLRADAQLFAGDREAAIETADRAVAITRASADVSDQTDAFIWATQIRAWAGAQDEATARLETLASSVPGLWPGEIFLDPLWKCTVGAECTLTSDCVRASMWN